MGSFQRFDMADFEKFQRWDFGWEKSECIPLELVFTAAFQIHHERCPEPRTQCPGGFEGVKVVVERGILNCSSPLWLARHSC
jgi:hypothetical protein